MKRGIVWVICLWCGILTGKADGIHFFRGSYEEALHQAAKEGKMIFMDVYTPWCGPCLNMEEKVFSQDRVGAYYNAHFINVRMDWEGAEGRILAQRFHVASFPAFLFIDPETGSLVHAHGGSQTADVFLRIGQAARNPILCSSFLETAYGKGNGSKDILLHYAAYRAERREMKEALRLLDEAIGRFRLSLCDPETADFFFEFFTMNEMEHSFCRYFLNHREQMEQLYGKERVERKIFDLYRYCTDRFQLEQLPDFKGRKFLLAVLDFNSCVTRKKYEDADRIMQDMVTDPEMNRQELYDLMSYTARSVMKRGGEQEWKRKCLSYMQYVAYNQEDRRDPEIHFQYAAMLEAFIREQVEVHSFFPGSIVEGPKLGKAKYTLNSRTLAPKR